MLTNFDHDRQWFNTLIPPSHESAAVTVDGISRLSGPVRLILRYTYHVRHPYIVETGGTSETVRQSMYNAMFDVNRVDQNIYS